MEQLKSSSQVYLDFQGRCKQVALNQKYGCGGSKCAYKLDAQHALVLPNPSSGIPLDLWSSIVLKEVGMTQWLSQQGLLTPEYEPATAHFQKECRDNGVPGYVGVSFDALSKRGIYVYDVDSLPKRGSLPYDIFHKDANPSQKEAWDCLMESLLQDIPHVYQVGVHPADMDSIHFALIVHPCQHTAYRLRYFGYDFSSKKMQLISRYTPPALLEISAATQQDCV